MLADARWRDAAALCERCRAASTPRCTPGSLVAHGPEAQRLKMDALYVTRIRPSHAGFFDWNALESRVGTCAGGGCALDLRRRRPPRRTGVGRARIPVVGRRARAFHVFRGADDVRFGFLALIDVGRAGASAPADPAIAAACAFVETHGPVTRAEGVVHLRWWMHAEAYQAVTAAINLTAMHVVSHCLTRAAIAWNFVSMHDPSYWAAHFDGVNFPRVPEADFQVGGRPYGVFAHDWRVEPPADWLMGARIPMPYAAAMVGSRPDLPLGPAEFQRAVRQALRDYTRADSLGQGPLRACRLVREAGDAGAAAATLRRLLNEAAETLLADPRDQKLHRAVWLTYFEPLASQERVAERLALPFSTYRRHLARGIERISRWLWLRERSLPPA